MAVIEQLEVRYASALGEAGLAAYRDAVRRTQGRRVVRLRHAARVGERSSI